MELASPRPIRYATSPLLASKTPPWRSRFVISLIALAFSMLFARTIYVMLIWKPSGKTELARAAISKDSLSSLAVEIERLSQLSTKTDSLSINELRQAIQRSTEVASRAAVDLQSQAKTWEEIRRGIAEDKVTHDTLKANLLEIKKLHAEEIVRVKSLIDAATRPSVWGEVFNLAISFIFGVLSSILASWIYDQRKRDVKEVQLKAQAEAEVAESNGKLDANSAAAMRLERPLGVDEAEMPAFLRRPIKPSASTIPPSGENSSKEEAASESPRSDA